MEASVTEECIACELCTEICPEVFEMGDEFAEVQMDDIPPEYEELVREAADECPVDAIEVEE